MIIVSNDFRMIITTMSHETIEENFAAGQDCAWFSGSDNSAQKTHWYAEPSIMRDMKAFCEERGELFQVIKGKPL